MILPVFFWYDIHVEVRARAACCIRTKSYCMQVRKVAEENGVDVSGQIRELEDRAKQVSTVLTP